jgi:uncharacterized protein
VTRGRFLPEPCLVHQTRLAAIALAVSALTLVSACGPSYREPKYAAPDATFERKVVVGQAWPLPGIWTCPAKPGRYPAVVLVGGSGRVDRDAAVEVNKPFRDIALGLSARGICVLRYDKRKAAHPERIIAQFETLTIRDDTIDDALLAIDVARQQPEADPRFIFVAGHSLGAYAVPRLSASSHVPCGFVAMAGPVDPLEQNFVPQARRYAAADGEITAAERAKIAELELAVRRVQELQPGTTIDRKLLPGRLPVAYWLDLKAHPAAVDAEAMTRPVLVLHGAQDLKVSADEMKSWRRHLRNNRLASFVTYPTLNHLFVHSPEGFVGDAPPGNVDEVVIGDIARWIAKHRSYCETEVPLRTRVLE